MIPRNRPVQTCGLPRWAPPIQTCRLPRRAPLKGIRPQIRMLPFRSHPIESGRSGHLLPLLPLGNLQETMNGRSSRATSGRSSMANMRSGQSGFAVNDRHFDKGTFDHYKLQFKAGTHSSHCKFSQRIKCAVQVKQPNDLRVNWLYSVPCGHNIRRTAHARPGSS